MADPFSVGLTLALTAAQMAMTMTRKIEGPRLQDLKVSVADYGTPLNYFYGIRRFQGVPIIFAEDIIEVKKKKKTKGGKYNDYTYYCTWAVAIADHLIDKVTRIWFDKHLIYDVTGAGPVTPFDFGDFNSAARKRLQNSSPAALEHIRIYLGTEDQEPDPRMVATVEEKNGVGSCPAYRGVSYILFEDVPLEKVGNRIPQISVEGITSAAPSYPWDSRDTSMGIPSGNVGVAPDFSRFVVNSGDNYEIWDMASRSLMLSGTVTDAGSRMAVGSDGSLYYVRGSFFVDDKLIRTGPDGIGEAELADLPAKASHIFALLDGDGNEYVVMTPYSTGTVIHIWNVEFGILNSIDLGWTANYAFTDGYGDIWVTGASSGATAVANMQRIVNASGRGVASAVTFPASKSAGIPSVDGAHNLPSQQYVIYASGALHFLDDETFAVNSTASPLGAVYWPTVSPSDTRAYAYSSLTTYEFSLADGASIQAFPMANWKSESTESAFYDPINHAMVSDHLSNTFTWRYLERAGSAGVTLASIINDVAERCGIDPDDIDASDCDQIVQGYSWTQGAGKTILEPLCDAYDSFCRPHDFGLEFLKRGAASGGTIDVAQFVRQGSSDEGGGRYIVRRTLPTDLPRRITFTFADVDADQQQNSVVVQRPLDAIDGVRELSIDMTTLALDVDEARSLADRVFRRKWFGRVSVQNALSAQYLAIEPGDVRVLNLDSEIFRGRAGPWTYGADGVIALEWERDDVAVASLSGAEGAPMDGREDSVIAVPLVSKGFVLDIPLITDSDNSVNPLLYYGAAPYSADGSWPGAVVYQSLDDGEEYSDEVGSVPSTGGLTWGLTNGVLPDALPWVWDRLSTVAVTVKYGTLTSTTEDECDRVASTNLCLIGDELVQFTTATLDSEDANGKVYTLSGFKRGRRGTEWATGTHATSEQFVMLDNADDFEMGASDLGEDLLFKAVTVGRDASSAFPIPVDDYEGNSHKPYAPANFRAVRDAGSGDWSFTWDRRSRIGGRWVGGTTVPLGESAENYKLKIRSGGTVVRTIAITSEAASYSSADQSSDFGSPQTSLTNAGVLQVGDLMDGREILASF